MAKRIVIADDIKFVRDTISGIVKKAHYQVVGEAKTGLQALEMYLRFRPDVVTMDIVMPELSGIEATREIIKKDREAKIIIVSAMSQESLIMEAVNAGARDYVMKPFSEADILKALGHVLRENERGAGSGA